MDCLVLLQLGQLASDNPEEEKRQKDFKSLLNKITLDNYETIRDKIIAVGIASPVTLRGLIDQVRARACSGAAPPWAVCWGSAVARTLSRHAGIAGPGRCTHQRAPDSTFMRVNEGLWLFGVPT